MSNNVVVHAWMTNYVAPLVFEEEQRLPAASTAARQRWETESRGFLTLAYHNLPQKTGIGLQVAKFDLTLVLPVCSSSPSGVSFNSPSLPPCRQKEARPMQHLELEAPRL